MKIIGKHSDWTIAIISIITFIILCYVPIIRNYSFVPSERFYIGSSPYPIDLIGDLEVMQNGYEGKWSFQSKVTTWNADMPWQYKTIYILLGHVARLIRQDNLVVLTTATILLSFLTLFCFYWFISRIFSDKTHRLFAFFLTLFYAGVLFPGEAWQPILTAIGKIESFTFVFERFTHVAPHYLLSYITSLLSFYFLSKAIDRKQYVVSIGISSLIAYLTMLIYAPASFLFLMTFPFLSLYFLLLTIIQKNSFFDFLKKIVPLVCFTLASTVPFIHYLFIMSQTVVSAEWVIQFPFSAGEYFFVVGPIVVFILCSIPFLLSKKTPTLILMLISWAVMHPISLLVLEKFPLFSVKRIFSTPYIVILAILATYGISFFLRNIKRCTSDLKRSVLFGTIGILTLFGGWNAYGLSWYNLTDCFCIIAPYPYGYPKKDVMNAIAWLKNNTTPSDVILSGFHIGALIPAFSGNRVYFNYWMRLAEPPNMTEVLNDVIHFFQNSMTEEEAEQFVKIHNISYVFTTDDDNDYQISSDATSYAFFTPVFSSNKTIIYKVK